MRTQKKILFHVCSDIIKTLFSLALCLFSLIITPLTIIYLRSTSSLISFQSYGIFWRDILHFWDFILLGTVALGLFLLITLALLVKVVRERAIFLGAAYALSLFLYLGVYIYLYQSISPKLDTTLTGAALIAAIWLTTSVLFGSILEKLDNAKVKRKANI